MKNFNISPSFLVINKFYRNLKNSLFLYKNNQVKFRIDDHIKIAFRKILENKKITINNIGIINRKYYKKY